LALFVFPLLKFSKTLFLKNFPPPPPPEIHRKYLIISELHIFYFVINLLQTIWYLYIVFVRTAISPPPRRHSEGAERLRNRSVVRDSSLRFGMTAWANGFLTSFGMTETNKQILKIKIINRRKPKILSKSRRDLTIN